jgi:ferritin-like metal-binding protein YciE
LPVAAELIRQYLVDAIAAEKAFEVQLRSFAAEGDDEDVQLAFGEHAEETRLQHERLSAHLRSFGSAEPKAESSLAALSELPPKLAQAGSTVEERLVQHLISAFCIETGECAMYEALAAVAHAVGDVDTEALAREIQAEERQAAEKIWHFLPTRSKIAFNVLTADEIDPAVETKVGQGLI